MRPELLRRSGRTIAGLAIVCLTAGSLLPGSAPAAAVADRVVTAAAPVVEYEQQQAPDSIADGARSGAESSPAAAVPGPGNSSRATGTVTSSGISASDARSSKRSQNSEQAAVAAAPQDDRATTPASPKKAADTSASDTAASNTAASNTVASKALPPLPQLAAAPALHLSVPSIGVDADVQPVDSVPTGEINAFGGPVYSQIDFPVDADVRQWVRRGDPNSIAPAEAAADVTSFDRVVLYGHASDIGNQLVFQDLPRLALGDPIEVRTANGTFTYQVTLVATNDKATLDAMPELYDYPTGGRKEIALVACLPDTSSNAVVIGVLVGATAA